MMDIKKELLEISSSSNFGADIYRDIKEHQKELAKKLHIVKIVSALTEIDELISEKVFERDEIKFLHLYTIEFNGKKILGFDGVDEKSSSFILDKNYYPELFERIFKKNELDLSFTNINLKSIDLKFELKSGISQELLNIFLNDELMKIYEYNKLEIDLPVNVENGKKLKV